MTDDTAAAFRRAMADAEGLVKRYSTAALSDEDIDKIAQHYADAATHARQMMTTLYESGETENHFGHVLLTHDEAVDAFTNADGTFDIDTYRDYTDVLKEQERKYVNSGVGS